MEILHTIPGLRHGINVPLWTLVLEYLDGKMGAIIIITSAKQMIPLLIITDFSMLILIQSVEIQVIGSLKFEF